MFLFVSRLDVRFGFEHPFSAYAIGSASKIERQKNRAPRKKRINPCVRMSYYTDKIPSRSISHSN